MTNTDELPWSDDAHLAAGERDFLRRVLLRLRAGEREYGAASFEQPLARIATEIGEEVIDVCGWSRVMWDKIRRLEELCRHGDLLDQLIECSLRVYDVGDSDSLAAHREATEAVAAVWGSVRDPEEKAE